VNETSETFCPNCSNYLINYITTDGRHEGYCKNHECNFSTNYDQNYIVSLYYFWNHGANIEGFKFTNNVDKWSFTGAEKTAKLYSLSLDNVYGFEDVKELLRKSVNSIKPLHILE
jgi:hypothetical protein